MARLLNTAGVFVTFFLSFLMQLHEFTKEIFVGFHRSDRQTISAERDTPIDVVRPELPHELVPEPPPPPVIPFVNDNERNEVANRRLWRSPQTVHDFGGYSSIPLPLRALSEQPPSAFITVK